VRQSFIKPHGSFTCSQPRDLLLSRYNLRTTLRMQKGRSGRCPPLSHRMFNINQRDQPGQDQMKVTTKSRTNAVCDERIYRTDLASKVAPDVSRLKTVSRKQVTYFAL
jgi:hypothetical protein